MSFRTNDDGDFDLIELERTAVAADYTTTDSDLLIAVTSTAAARTITLLSATVTEGRIFIIKDESGAAGTNNITIATEGSETIDGSATLVISTNYGSATLYSDGVDWFVI